MPFLSRRATLAASLTLLLPLSACATGAGTATPGASGAPGAPAPSTAAPTPAATSTVGTNSREVASVAPRLVYSHEGGLAMVDTETGKVIHEEDHPGFLRLNDGGDGRHVFVTDGDQFLVYDTGIRARPHGDHAHYYESEPGLTSQVYDMPLAGHATPHDGWTTLFSDGTGRIVSIPSDKVADPGPLAEETKTDAPHHGVALKLSDDTLLTTQGTESERHTVQVKDGDKVVAETTDCPGTHGEAVAKPTEKGDVVLLGCTNGPVVYRDGAFHKVTPPDAWARTGNSAGSHASPIVLTDYKVEKDAKLERPTRVALVDTVKDKLDLVELGSSYWFRSLARGAHGEALVLTYDGNVTVIDPATKKVIKRIKAIAPWQEKDKWQLPGPSIKVAGHDVYVTDAENRKLVVVDLEKGEVEKTFDLPHTPVEIAVTTGSAQTEDEHDHAHEGEGEGHHHG